MRNFITRISWILITILAFTSCNKDKPIIFANNSNVWWLAPTIFISDFYESEKLNVRSFDVQTGVASKNAVLAKSADIGIIASSPLAMGGYEKEYNDIVVLGRFIQATTTISIVSIDSVSTQIFPSEPIGLTPGTISELYFLQYKEKYFDSINYKDLKMMSLRPPDGPNAIKNKDVSSLVTWEPFSSVILDSKFADYHYVDPSLYNIEIYLITRKDVLKNKRSSVVKFLNALQKSCDYINESPTEVKEKLKIRFPHHNFERAWDGIRYGLKKDVNEFTAQFNFESELAVKAGLRDAVLSKNIYKKYFDLNFLNSLD